MLLKDKTVFVTGGSRGIGAAIVRAALREGARVAFTYSQSQEQADALCRELVASRPSAVCQALRCDVRDGAGMEDVLNRVASELGPVDVVVNNAGIVRDDALVKLTRERWDEVISTNLGGMFNATRPVVFAMMKRKTGVILNLSSIAGVYGNAGQTNYSASKAGIIGFTKALAKETAAYGIRVNAIAPGFIETEMTSDVKGAELSKRIPLRRFGAANEVAELACFLASDRAAYITGQTIQIDGGLTL
jgi:3-oxoacyl-[acyl-carrier protein] reductase